MFTEEDNAKAVEMYGQYRMQPWWPAKVHWNAHGGAWQRNIDGEPHWDGNQLEADHALALIAWAMAEEVLATGSVSITHGEDGPTRIYMAARHAGPYHVEQTAFLALASALEDHH